jgi:hypothetical protein
MRITRDTLLKNARDSAAQLARQDRRIICIYLTGSMLSDGPLLGGTTDIDLVAVHDEPPLVDREIIRQSDEIHLDIAHYSQSVFRNPRHLRLDPWIGSSLWNGPLCLYDTQHWFEFNQASVSSQFSMPINVIQRARPLAESARQGWAEIHKSKRPFSPQRTLTYLDVLSNSANAIACLKGEPLTERRFLLRFPARAEAIGRPGLADGFTDLLQLEPVSAELWQIWQTGWQAAFEQAGAEKNAPAELNSACLNYYLRGASAVFAQNPAAGLWPLLRSWTLAVSILPAGSPLLQPWMEACQTLGLDESHWSGRLNNLDSYLDSVEEALDDWSHANGV